MLLCRWRSQQKKKKILVRKKTTEENYEKKISTSPIIFKLVIMGKNSISKFKTKNTR
jgi:hypothetical protein